MNGRRIENDPHTTEYRWAHTCSTGIAWCYWPYMDHRNSVDQFFRPLTDFPGDHTPERVALWTDLMLNPFER